jgi:hypothetical protein
MVRKLIAAGANVNFRRESDVGYKLLQDAVIIGNIEIVTV